MAEKPGPPKSWATTLAYYAAGAAVKVTDEDLGIVLFLDRHPGWTWSDLMVTPDHIVTAMKRLDTERAKHGKQQ